MTPTTATPEDLVLALPEIAFAAIDDLVPSPLNPRKSFGALDELAANIAARGVLVPCIVRGRGAMGTGVRPYLEIVDGERRYRAAKQAGMKTVPVIRRDDLNDSEVMEIQIISAIQRQDLTPLEEARGYRALLDSNTAKYSATYIADRISRSEKYVVDRMRLLALIPALQQLLDDERIGVGHAELLAKLKDEDQQRAIDPGVKGRYDLRKAPGGLWEDVGATLAFDLDDERKREGADPYAGLKPVTVKELEAWIARHVRFDVEHFATTAPLEFGDTAERVTQAQQQPGRGKKVIAITADYRVDDDARTDERVYGSQSWRRADGTEGTSRNDRNKPIDSPTCEHSVLGVFAVGPGYGTALQVCVARDRCRVHWAKEIKEREKNAKLRAAGQGKKADTREKKAADSYEERQRKERERRAVVNAEYRKLYPLVAPAIEGVLPATLTRQAFNYLWDTHLGSKVPDVDESRFVSALVMSDVSSQSPQTREDSWTNYEHNRASLIKIAKAFGVDTKPFEQQVAAELKAAAKATEKPAPKAAAKTTKKTAAKTPSTKKAAKKR